MNFEYVLSGMNYTRGVLKPDSDLIKSYYQKYFNENKSNGVRISTLFNAYREETTGKNLQSLALEKIYADSGGLQMALFGLDVNKEERSKIYEVQEKYSHLAFCFDDIPLEFLYEVAGSSARTDIDSKFFNYDLLKEKALKTSNNIKEQVNYFFEKDSDTKVWAIIQGNCHKTFAEWGNHLFSNLNDDEIKKIHGLAIADTCIGNDIRETLHMVRSIDEIEAPDFVKQNIHFLGVGSLSRLAPIIELANSPILKGKHISFDSTSHVSSFALGKFYNNDLSITKVGKHRSYKAELMIQEVLEDTMPEYLESDLYDVILKELNTMAFETDNHEFREDLVAFHANYAFHMVNKFTFAIKDVFENKNHYKKYMKNQKNISLLNTLRDLNSNDDLDYWMKNYSRFLPSKKITSHRMNNILEFFGE